MKLSDLKKHIKVVKDSSIFTHGLSVGNHCVIDGPINSKDQLHIISHAHQDHVTDPHIKKTMGIQNGKMVSTEPTKKLLRHGAKHRNIIHDYRFDHLEYGEISKPYIEQGNIQVEFKDAGHILGSAQVKVIDPEIGFTVGYSGDIGAKVHTPIDSDVLILDATYSNVYEDGTNFQRDLVFEAAIDLVNYAINNEINLNIAGSNGILQELLHIIGSETELWNTNKNVYTDKKQIIDWVNTYKDYPEKGNQPKEIFNLMDSDFFHGDGYINLMKLKKEKKQIINIFNNSNDAQNIGKKDLILNIDNSPFKKIHSLDELRPQKNKYFYNLPLTAHETGESMYRYIEMVNPSVILTDVRSESNNDLELSKNIVTHFPGIGSWTTRELESFQYESSR